MSPAKLDCQRMPDMAVRAGDQATTLHRVLRGGRHVLVVPPAGSASVVADATFGRYRAEVGSCRR